MSAASTTSPTVVRSSSRRQPSYNPPSNERPVRTPSAATRSPTTPVTLNRSDSQTQPSARPLSSSQQASLAGVARRDYESTNVARPTSSRRSSSRDRSYAAPPPKRAESTRDTRRTSQRPGNHSRNNSQMSTTGNAAAGAAGTTHGSGSTRVHVADAAAPGPTTRKRTEIDAQTGKWSLGKTIGAGSMGKVKLAKNLESGEQVGFSQGCAAALLILLTSD